MSATHQTAHLPALAGHAADHLELMQQLLGGRAPARPQLERATRATRALRGSASLLGLDAFQAFLGRLFLMLDDVVASGQPWSNRLEEVLRHALDAESSYVTALQRGSVDRAADLEVLSRADAHLAAWRRDQTPQASERVSHDDSQRNVSQSASSGGVPARVLGLVERVRALREVTQTTGNGVHVAAALDELQNELLALHVVLTAEPDRIPALEPGLRNHCEGGLRQLVEAAAQEVLHEAQDSGTRLAIRATGSVDIVDDELGGALLEILRNLWLDSGAAQTGIAEPCIDTVFRVEPQRLVFEVRDAGNAEAIDADDDVLARYAGLRRSRPLLEALQALVWAETSASPSDCRFRVSLPLSAATMEAVVVRVGAQEIGLPASAVEGVHELSRARLIQDATGAVVEVAGQVQPLLNLALRLSDPSLDALQRDCVVIVGSVERRAAILASGPVRRLSGNLQHVETAPWLGRLEENEAVRVLDVSGLLGRKTGSQQRPKSATLLVESEPPVSQARRILVVDSSEVERRSLGTLLHGDSHRAVVVQRADEAWQVLESEPVDLVMCDLRLPEMNAQQLTARIRREGRFKDIPIVLILSHVGEQARLVVEQLGVADFVRSPVRREELLRVVGRLTEESSQG